MATLARVITAFSLLVLFAGEAFAQDTPTYTTNSRFRKWTEGQYPSADSINANWNELDSLLNTKLTSTSASTGDLMVNTIPISDASGSAWLGADNRVSFYPFTVAADMTPDSVYFFSASNNATTDTLYVSIHTWDGTSKVASTGPMVSPSASTNQWWRAAFDSTSALSPGTYLIAYASPNMVTATPIPTVPILISATAHYPTGNPTIGGVLRVGQIVGGLSSGTIQSDLTSGATAFQQSGFPNFVILGQ